MRSCELCDEKAHYRDRISGVYLCLEHSRFEVVAPRRQTDITPLELRQATPSDRGTIEALCLYFWGETVVDCFDQQYDVLACPAILACKGRIPVGLASYAIEAELDAAVLVVLNVLPEVQGQGLGRALIDATCDRARESNLRCILVVTSNDDLPALGLYQRYGFRIRHIVTGRIAEHHGGEVPGFAAIPVRDEIQLVYELRDR